MPRPTDRLPSSGVVTVTVLFAEFASRTAARSPQEVFSYIADVGTFYDAVSHGAVQIELIPHFEWLPMAGPASFYAGG